MLLSWFMPKIDNWQMTLGVATPLHVTLTLATCWFHFARLASILRVIAASFCCLSAFSVRCCSLTSIDTPVTDISCLSGRRVTRTTESPIISAAEFKKSASTLADGHPAGLVGVVHVRALDDQSLAALLGARGNAGNDAGCGGQRCFMDLAWISAGQDALGSRIIDVTSLTSNASSLSLSVSFSPNHQQ